MALGAKAVLVNAALQTYELAMEDFMDGLIASDRHGYFFIFADKWRGVTSSTNLDAKFPDLGIQAKAQSRIEVPIKVDTASDENIIWALPGINIGRIPLTFRLCNAAGEVDYS